MGQLINSSTFSDVSFMVEGRNIFAHKAILAQRSAYFDNLFSNTSLQVNTFLIKLLQMMNTGILSTPEFNTGLRHKIQHFYVASGVHVHGKNQLPLRCPDSPEIIPE